MFNFAYYMASMIINGLLWALKATIGVIICMTIFISVIALVDYTEKSRITKGTGVIPEIEIIPEEPLILYTFTLPIDTVGVEDTTNITVGNEQDTINEVH